ncbi:phosphoglycerol transferase MdoB-like AlkP superfamily enzyme [Anaerobacterium chartisolvens]|uniref:Phosphoglycerol transferase MdoB-like AlkP superfamily enzyme n=1 Tax=Anaerobacterium chartisolvens TaxID=1297424 RepID=A0A369AP52_9FIRM|nr:LTA synthase family protein [Anaerobacterium chartisolvens]RCX09977.1 phosphoglycerol transferase MdoB-like AlkP superfamily enzyme [Anaerobacterium chartisolvens]
MNININRNKLKPVFRFFTGNVEVFLFVLSIYIKSFLFNQIIGIHYGNILIAAALGPALLLLGLFISMKRKWRLICLLSVNALISIIMLSDAIYYRYYNSVLSVPVLMQLGVVDPALKSSILKLFTPRDLLLAADVIIAAPVLLLLLKLKRIRLHSVRHRLLTSAAVLVLGCFFTLSGMYNIDRLMGFKSLSTVFDHSFFVNNIGVLNYHCFDIWYFASNRLAGNGEDIAPDEAESIKAVFIENENTAEGRNLHGIAKGKNLIVIQVEAMQSIVINLKIDGREVTPNLNRLIKNSFYFPNYYTQAGQGNTADAEFVTNNSFYAAKQGAIYFRYPGNKFTSLPALLKEKGYSTTAMHAYKASYWNRATVYPFMGFDSFMSQKDYILDECIGGWGLTDESFLRQSLDKIKDLQQPFYSFLVTLSSHYPYDSFGKNEYGNEFNAGSHNGTFLGRYLKAMHYADQTLGQFLDGLKDNGLMDSSVIAIYGDHEGIKKGDMEGIKGVLGLSPNDELAYLEMKKVPLIIHIPGGEQKGVKPQTGGQVDLYPTLANLLGAQPEYYLGRDLLNSERSLAIFRDGSVTDGSTVYFSGTGQCFDLSSGEPAGTDGFKEYIEEAGKQLEISDKIIENNLLKDFTAG